ncbi:hypothetical protein [Candidatus Steffania adelgidicola]|nr:hypothetical protein [Candidatus Steffania adelgidicola]
MACAFQDFFFCCLSIRRNGICSRRERQGRNKADIWRDRVI